MHTHTHSLTRGTVVVVSIGSIVGCIYRISFIAYRPCSSSRRRVQPIDSERGERGTVTHSSHTHRHNHTHTSINDNR